MQHLRNSFSNWPRSTTDGNAHSVQVYADISAEWVSGDDSLTANWTTTTGSLLTHQVQLESQIDFSEISDHIQREHYDLFESTSFSS